MILWKQTIYSAVVQAKGLILSAEISILSISAFFNGTLLDLMIAKM